MNDGIERAPVDDALRCLRHLIQCPEPEDTLGYEWLRDWIRTHGTPAYDMLVQQHREQKERAENAEAEAGRLLEEISKAEATLTTMGFEGAHSVREQLRAALQSAPPASEQVSYSCLGCGQEGIPASDLRGERHAKMEPDGGVDFCGPIVTISEPASESGGGERCPECGGRGRFVSGQLTGSTVECSTCKGTGKPLDKTRATTGERVPFEDTNPIEALQPRSPTDPADRPASGVDNLLSEMAADVDSLTDEELRAEAAQEGITADSVRQTIDRAIASADRPEPSEAMAALDRLKDLALEVCDDDPATGMPSSSLTESDAAFIRQALSQPVPAVPDALRQIASWMDRRTGDDGTRAEFIGMEISGPTGCSDAAACDRAAKRAFLEAARIWEHNERAAAPAESEGGAG